MGPVTVNAPSLSAGTYRTVRYMQTSGILVRFRELYSMAACNTVPSGILFALFRRNRSVSHLGRLPVGQACDERLHARANFLMS
jgi:hypothetical protein